MSSVGSSIIEHKIHGTAAVSLGTTKLSGDMNTEPETHELDSIAEPTAKDIVTSASIDDGDDKHGVCTDSGEPIQTETAEHSRPVEVFDWNLDEFAEDSTKPNGSDSNLSGEGGGEEGEEEKVNDKDDDKDMGNQWDKALLGFHRVSDAFEVPVVAMSPTKQETKSGKERVEDPVLDGMCTVWSDSPNGSLR